MKKIEYIIKLSTPDKDICLFDSNKQNAKYAIVTKDISYYNDSALVFRIPKHWEVYDVYLTKKEVISASKDFAEKKHELEALIVHIYGTVNKEIK